jgi:YD repeat-containing protein
MHCGRGRAAAFGAVVMLIWLLAAGAADASVTYTYDALGRLATAAYSTGKTIVYSYDSAGNRTAKVIVTAVKWGSFTWGSASWS